MIQSDDILITKLPAEPQTSDGLRALTAKVTIDKPTSDLLVDLGAIDEPSYQTLCELISLSRLLSDLGRCCLFFNLSEATRKIFQLYGFDSIFQILDSSDLVLTPLPEQLNSGILELHSSKERRKYTRFRVPSWLQVNVLLWYGGRKGDYNKVIPGNYWFGNLVDISEGGIQVAIDATVEVTLEKGRLVGVEFRPNPSDPDIAFDAEIREVLPTADGNSICLGLQFVRLETNPEGLQALQRL